MAKDVVIKIGADDRASGVFAQVAQNLKKMQKESRAAGEGVLQRTLSSPGGLVQAGLDAAGLGIAGLVVDQVGGAFAKVTDKVLEMREQVRLGKADYRDLANEVALSIPILGPFVKGFENLRELITGEKAEIEAIKADTEATNKYMAARISIAEMVTAQHKQSLEVIRQIRNESRLLGMAESDRLKEQNRQQEEATLIAAKTAAEEKKKKNSDNPAVRAAEEALREINAKNNPEILDLQQRLLGAGDKPMEKEWAKEWRKRLDILVGEVADKQGKLDELNKEKKKANAQAEADALAAIREASILRAGKDAEAEKKIQTQRADSLYESSQRVKGIMAEAAQAALEAAGQNQAVEQKKLADARDKEIDDARHRRDVAMRNQNFQEQKDTWDRWEQERAAIEGRFESQSGLLAKKQSDERMRIFADAGQAEKDAQVARQAELLDAQGQAADAAILRIKNDGEKRIAEIRRQAKAEADAHAESAEDIRRRAEADIARTESETGSQIRQERQKELDRRIDENERNVRKDAWFGQIVQPNFQLSSRGSGAAARAREDNAIMIQHLNLQKQMLETQKFIRAASEATALFFKRAPEFVELLGGVN